MTWKYTLQIKVSVVNLCTFIHQIYIYDTGLFIFIINPQPLNSNYSFPNIKHAEHCSIFDSIARWESTVSRKIPLSCSFLISCGLSEATGPVGCWHRVETVAGDWWPDRRRQSSTIAIVDYSDSVTPQPSQSTSGTPPALATHNITLETRVVQLNIVTFYTPQCTIATTAPLITFFACTHSKKNTLALRWPRKFRPVWLLLDTGAAAPSYQSSVT